MRGGDAIRGEGVHGMHIDGLDRLCVKARWVQEKTMQKHLHIGITASGRICGFNALKTFTAYRMALNNDTRGLQRKIKPQCLPWASSLLLNVVTVRACVTSKFYVVCFNFAAR